MYIIAIGWAYVILMVAATSGSLIKAWNAIFLGLQFDRCSCSSTSQMRHSGAYATPANGEPAKRRSRADQ